MSWEKKKKIIIIIAILILVIEVFYLTITRLWKKSEEEIKEIKKKPETIQEAIHQGLAPAPSTPEEIEKTKQIQEELLKILPPPPQSPIKIDSQKSLDERTKIQEAVLESLAPPANEF